MASFPFQESRHYSINTRVKLFCRNTRAIFDMEYPRWINTEFCTLCSCGDMFLPVVGSQDVRGDVSIVSLLSPVLPRSLLFHCCLPPARPDRPTWMRRASSK